MFYLNLKHNIKKEHRSQNAFHYLTRTAHFKNQKDDEDIELIQCGNMPKWAENNPKLFWKSADQFEISRGRTSSVLTIALPKELMREHRIELVQVLIQSYVGQYQFPYTAVIHNHPSEITGEEQPHLHLMYSERTLSDDIERLPEQFFKQYRPKNPTQGGAQKLTADALGFGKKQVKLFREKAEEIINLSLEKYAPTKKVMVYGVEVEVKNKVSCLSNQEFNQKFGTRLQDVPQIPRWKLYSADPIIQLEVAAQKETIKKIRQDNLNQMYNKDYELTISKMNVLQQKNKSDFNFDY